LRLVNVIVILIWASSVGQAGNQTDGLFIRTDFLNQLVSRESSRFSDSINISAVQLEKGQFSFDLGGHDFYNFKTKRISSKVFEITDMPFRDLQQRLTRQVATLTILNKDSLKIVFTDRKSAKVVKEFFFVSSFKDLVFEQPIMTSINRLLLKGTYLLSSDNKPFDTLKISESGLVGQSKLFKISKFFNAYFQSDKNYPGEHYFIFSLSNAGQLQDFAIPTDFYKRDEIPLYAFAFVKERDWLNISRDNRPKYMLRRLTNGT